ncbi:predicted protein [Sclerotinia sclerotiorum 1980 UF-70]|uniref:Uncharacterized protein n=1 Tax=Sclerotinia sclerotiorum (strain ATCC 18683 / 1980 / Ss-1) TaxID=665079 RepID=A7F0K0_SCLS1|nr:predicted protein [Sclerotinia sclerotiorum 1980 UF-70]EDN95242.1 predicted protein [Sclerotinia sclerotiorum 1980 UF-70]
MDYGCNSLNIVGHKLRFVASLFGMSSGGI